MIMKTIIVFGATGKVGVYLTLYLKECGYNVIAVGKRNTDNGFFDDYSIPYFSVDILNQSTFKCLPSSGVYGVVHLAALLPATMDGYNPRSYVESNIYGTMNVLDYAVSAKIQRFIYPKSWSDIIYLCGSLTPINVDSPIKFPLDNDHTIYAITKNAACDIVKHYSVKYKFKYYILRFPNIFCYHPNPFYFVGGEKRWQGAWRIIEQAKEGEDIELWGDPECARDVFYVKDCIQIIEKTLSANGESGLYNVGTGIATSRYDQIKGIIDVFSPHDKKSNIIIKKDKPNSPHYVLDISKTVEQLGYKPKYDYLSYLEDIKKEMIEERFKKIWGRRSDYINE